MSIASLLSGGSTARLVSPRAEEEAKGERPLLSALRFASSCCCLTAVSPELGAGDRCQGQLWGDVVARWLRSAREAREEVKSLRAQLATDRAEEETTRRGSFPLPPPPLHTHTPPLYQPRGRGLQTRPAAVCLPPTPPNVCEAAERGPKCQGECWNSRLVCTAVLGTETIEDLTVDDTQCEAGVGCWWHSM